MTHYRYRIQIGDQYTYRSGEYELGHLVEALLNHGVGYDQLEEINRLVRKAKGKNVPDPPKPVPVPPEKIRITVEKVAPPRPPQKEKWHKVGE